MAELNDKTFEEKINESTMLKNNYPNRVPIIIISNFDDLKKLKFLAPNDMKLIQLLYIIKKKQNINMIESFYIFTENKHLLNSTSSIISIYNNHKNKDGFLYLYLNKENTFG